MLVSVLAYNGRWPPKHVGGNKKLYSCVYCVRVCLFYKEENQNTFSVSNACMIPRTYEIPIIKIHNNDRSHEKQYKVYFL